MSIHRSKKTTTTTTEEHYEDDVLPLNATDNLLSNDKSPLTNNTTRQIETGSSLENFNFSNNTPVESPVTGRTWPDFIVHVMNNSYPLLIFCIFIISYILVVGIGAKNFTWKSFWNSLAVGCVYNFIFIIMQLLYSCTRKKLNDFFKGKETQ